MSFNESINTAYDFLEKKKFALALEHFEAAQKFQPDNADLRQMIAQVQMQADYALQMAEVTVNEAKSRAKVMGALGIELDITDAHTLRADIDKTIEEYSRNQTQQSATEILADAYYIRGLLFDAENEYAQSLAAYNETIRFVPDHRYALVRRGDANSQVGNYEQAIADYKSANLNGAELNQNLISVYMARGNKYGMNNEYAKAAEDFAKVLEINPNHNGARNGLDFCKAEMRK
jgi:tetratricopeptide (TPR) repeat protein